ncbi:FtsX-like permease family protein [Xanthomonas campestris pv. phormiicola]|nr:FtsX-like permease family protein [Xanthomonas campestris pv. phormiicola]UYC18411.1 FtsX-like permease family protein [Xanthomonas campestris pv. phormiicola]
MQIRIVLSALRKHRIATVLIALEISLACAVFCNACFLISQRLQAMRIDSGVDEAALGTVKLSGFDPQLASDLNARVVAALRGISAVKTVSVVNAVPFGEPGARAGVTLDQEQQHFGGVIDFYVGDASAIQAFGLRLLSGRLPASEEYTPVAQYVPSNPPVLITQKLAEHLWPGQNPIGQRLWSMDTSFRVIGVIDHLSVSQPGGGEAEDPDWSVFVPAIPGPSLAGKYLIRGNPEDIPAIMRDSRDAVLKVAPDAVFDMEQSRSLVELRDSYFKSSRVMAAMLFGVIVALLGTTALGIVGLASFWVTQRRKQIGIRRALGATRSDILRYFQIENFLIVSLGIVFGMLLAYGMSLVLMRAYELPRLPLWYMPIGAVTLWILGQLAVLAPALRASGISPVAAIRAI